MKQIQLTYHEESGYLYPDLTLPEQTHHPIGKYGRICSPYRRLQNRQNPCRHTKITTGASPKIVL